MSTDANMNQMTVASFSELKIIDTDTPVTGAAAPPPAQRSQSVPDPSHVTTLVKAESPATKRRRFSTSANKKHRVHSTEVIWTTAAAQLATAKRPRRRRRWNDDSSLGDDVVRRRMVFKNGDCNISNTNVRKRGRRYLADIFTTLVDMKWRYTLMLFVFAFLASWVGFALLWYIIGLAHGDFDEAHIANGAWEPCVLQVFGFTTALLFSIETQHTIDRSLTTGSTPSVYSHPNADIGYGSRGMNDECGHAIALLMVQSVVGVVIQALMTGVVFAKLSRPKKRAETLMFSKQALIALRDGKYCLMFRVGDMRRSHIIEAHVRGILISKRVTKEGEVDPLFHHELNMGIDSGADRILLVWPIIVQHEIDENSPLWRMSKEDLFEQRFELVLVLEGVIESTGSTTQARTSYLPSEVLWGHRFKRLVTYQKENGAYEIDYSRFHDTGITRQVAVDMPRCSAREYAKTHPESSSSSSDNGSSDEKALTSSAGITETTQPNQSRSDRQPNGFACLSSLDNNKTWAGDGLSDDRRRPLFPRWKPRRAEPMDRILEATPTDFPFFPVVANPGRRTNGAVQPGPRHPQADLADGPGQSHPKWNLEQFRKGHGRDSPRAVKRLRSTGDLAPTSSLPSLLPSNTEVAPTTDSTPVDSAPPEKPNSRLTPGTQPFFTLNGEQPSSRKKRFSVTRPGEDSAARRASLEDIPDISFAEPNSASDSDDVPAPRNTVGESSPLISPRATDLVGYDNEITRSPSVRSAGSGKGLQDVEAALTRL